MSAAWHKPLAYRSQPSKELPIGQSGPRNHLIPPYNDVRRATNSVAPYLLWEDDMRTHLNIYTYAETDEAK
ncbi:hypothetical protein CBM2634_U210001 [Cupriavidus taiwanensis]|uniref:Uncharacterized protein n=1 Tax=Cupriavidus taiwanensis TaxID=164546 RepID=A0A375JC56_9BURK|nr:hypothetical protein CBM2634_U210001 [Cupriavidus taiwanensis]